MKDIQSSLLQYIEFYETLKPDTLFKLQELVSDNVTFVDPFNSIVGVKAYSNILEDMFVRCQQPHFSVSHWAIKDKTAYIKWTFKFIPQKSSEKHWTIVGLSEVVFNDLGLVVEHRDYWDPASQLYERLPFIGMLLKWLRGKFEVK